MLVVSLLLAGWYLYVALRFYLGEIRDLVRGKQKLLFGIGSVQPSDTSPTQFEFQPTPSNDVRESAFSEADPTFQDVDNLVERLKSVISEATQRNLLRQEFKDYIALVLKEYPNVKESPFRASVSELLVSECERFETLRLDQNEAEALWD